MELLKRLGVPWRWDTRDIVKILVRTRIAQPLARWHLHPRAAAHKTELCSFYPYSDYVINGQRMVFIDEGKSTHK
jgi:hypothetical protein